MSQNTIPRDYAVAQVREMAKQFAQLYFEFVRQIRDTHGDEETAKIVTRVLFTRASQRAAGMITRAEADGAARVPENIIKYTDVPFLGWDETLGREMCPYGSAWNELIPKNPWFLRYAMLYCDVTDTTICEVFTGTHTHELRENVLTGGNICGREYMESECVKRGELKYI